MYKDFTKSGVIHKIVQQKIQSNLHTFKTALDIVHFIENQILILTKFNIDEPLKSGIGFPVGISINDVAAHFTPSNENNPIIKSDDIIKIDFGVHINGCISDGAFSWCPSGKYDELINISKSATEIGIKHSGPDDTYVSVHSVVSTSTAVATPATPGVNCANGVCTVEF